MSEPHGPANSAAADASTRGGSSLDELLNLLQQQYRQMGYGTDAALAEADVMAIAMLRSLADTSTETRRRIDTALSELGEAMNSEGWADIYRDVLTLFTTDEARWPESGLNLMQRLRGNRSGCEAVWKTLRRMSAQEPRLDVGRARLQALANWPNRSDPHTDAIAAGSLTIRFTDEVATTRSLGAGLTTLTRLYTKLWLASVGRYDDVIAYGISHDMRYEVQANLVIQRITTNSPVTVALTLSQSLGQAIASIIDAVTQAPLRWRMMQTQTQILANEQAAQQQHMAHEHASKQLELEKERLKLLLERTRVQQEMLDANIQMAVVAANVLRQQVDRLYPDADPAVRAMLVQSMLPDALRLGNFNLQIVPSEPTTQS